MRLFAFLRNSILRKTISLFVAVQIMNICIDPIDHLTGAQDISINEIESFTEFVLEVAMENENAVEETDETDEESDQSAATIILFLAQNKQLITETIFPGCQSKHATFPVSCFSSLTRSINLPPPRLAI